METFIAILHILVALILIALVLVQDSKSGSIGGAFGGGGSNSVLGATGATTLAQKLTRYTAVVFAGTCIMLTIFAARNNKSVLDSVPLPSAGPAQTTPAAAGAGAPQDANAAKPDATKPAEPAKQDAAPQNPTNTTPPAGTNAEPKK